MDDPVGPSDVDVTGRLDVVVPAHDEQTLIGSCLHALFADAGPVDLRVIVVANGCADRTADAARASLPVNRPGRQLHVVETPIAGKATALNTGDGYRRDCATLYLDADTVLVPGTVPALVAALDATATPRLVAPRPLPVRPAGRLARGYAAVWQRLPAVRGQVIGGGAYAVNPAGRRRWTDFPAVIADDAYVRSRFAPDERRLLDRGGFLLVLPEGRELIRVVRRWRGGNRQLAADTPSAGPARNLAYLLGRPGLWPHLPAFALVTAASQGTLGYRGTSGRGATPGRWERAMTVRATAPPGSSTASGAPGSSGTLAARHGGPVDAVVVTYRNRHTIDRCLSSLVARWAPLTVTVVDNGSDDGTADHVAAAYPGVRLIRNRDNRGFAAAVNQAARCGDGEHLLLVNPDVELGPDTVDQLLALATRFPTAGLYGGRAVDDTGRLDPTSCLPAPSLWQALTFGTGLSALHGVPVADPDSLGGWRRDDVRSVPVLTGAVLLVRRDLWRRLGGFDERYVLYGEDVDLCLRARRLGATAMFTPAARYRHTGGASSSPAERQIGILRGKVTLYRDHLPAGSGWLARRALLAGAALRALLSGGAALRAPLAATWPAVWRRRADWRSGW